MKVTQLYPALCDPMDYTVHGILQARILEWVAFPFSRVLPNLWIEPRSSHIAGRFFTSYVIKPRIDYTYSSHKWNLKPVNQESSD